jgi:phospholipase C
MQLAEQALSQTGNDYHPPGNVAVGEEHLREIYMSLTHREEAWKKTLLIITTDEAVGQFDHVPPPAATPPWGDRPPEEGRDLQRDLQYGFDFKRYGARVPTILVSPLIQQGTVFRSTVQQPYDHTSLIATILKWLGLEQRIGEFGERTRGAPTFEDVLTLAEPRTDARDIPFLKSTAKKGDPLRYYDRFYLQGPGGKLLSQAVLTRKNFLRLTTEYFPTMGDAPLMLHFENADDRPSTAQVKPGDGAKIITTDPEVGAFNVLGAWDDSVDCYYYNDYLTGEYNDKQTWVIRKEGGGPIVFGDQVTLVCRHGHGVLMEDPPWSKGGATYLKARIFRSSVWTLVAPERPE